MRLNRQFRKPLTVFAALLMAFVALPAMSADIRVVGLFESRAMLQINGVARLLRAGKTSPEGVKLISSTSQRAVIEHEGQRTTVTLSQHISSSFSAAKQTEVSLLRGAQGHYFGRGMINGYPVDFMVDTGATAIAMNSQQAKHLGLKLDKKNRGAASTAGGMVETYQVMLNKVSVGGITHHNIPAMVIDGAYPEHVLLGNSFLSKIEMEERNGVMILREK